MHISESDPGAMALQQKESPEKKAAREDWEARDRAFGRVQREILDIPGVIGLQFAGREFAPITIIVDEQWTTRTWAIRRAIRDILCGRFHAPSNIRLSFEEGKCENVGTWER